MSYQNVVLDKNNYVATLPINRPEVRNALDPQTWAEIRSAIRECRL